MAGNLRTEGQASPEQERKAEGWKQREGGQGREEGRGWLSGQQGRMWRKRIDRKRSGAWQRFKEAGGLKRRTVLAQMPAWSGQGGGGS